MDPIAALAAQQTLIQQPLSKRRTNAWRHGLRARQMTVPEAEREDFERLRDTMVKQWRPRNVAMWLLVDQVARLQWRLMRADEVEAERLEGLQADWKPAEGEERPGTERVSAEKAIARDIAGDGSVVMRVQLYQTRLERALRQTLGLLIAMRKSRVKRGNSPRDGARKKSPQLVVSSTYVVEPTK